MTLWAAPAKLEARAALCGWACLLSLTTEHTVSGHVLGLCICRALGPAVLGLTLHLLGVLMQTCDVVPQIPTPQPVAAMEVFRFDPEEWLPLLNYYAAAVGYLQQQTDSAWA